MPFVLDASISLAWAFSDERNAAAEQAAHLLEATTETAYVPDIWWYEVRNILVVGERRGRISRADTTLFLHRIAQMRIELDTGRYDLPMLDLARQHKLTVYDAAYLALALREHLPLATLDKHLQSVAVAEGIALLA
jgi:predicted nucleic acid-binding protein